MAVNAQQLFVCAARFLARTKPGLAISRSAIRKIARERGATTAELDAAEKTLLKHKVLERGFARGEFHLTDHAMRVACPADLGRTRRK